MFFDVFRGREGVGKEEEVKSKGRKEEVEEVPLVSSRWISVLV